MVTEWNFENTNVLITGGALGIGAAVAEALLKEGVKALAILDQSAEAGNALKNRLTAYSDRITVIECDVSNEDNLNEAFNDVLNKFKRLDVIINNAGIMDDSPRKWSKECDINLKAVISLTFKGIDHMSTGKGGAGGTIVNVSSMAAFYTNPFVPVYCGTKSAVLHFGRSISTGDFYERTGIKILTLCFGATQTAIFTDMRHKTYDAYSGEKLEEHLNTSVQYQSVDSAVTGFVEMLKNGKNGTVWFSGCDKPVKDITTVVDAAYGDIIKCIEE